MNKRRINRIIIGVICTTLLLSGCTNSKQAVINNQEIADESLQITEEEELRDLNELSNDRDYEWYINQENTGSYGNINCVPASVTMALKWINKDYKKSVEELRNEYLYRYGENGGWINEMAIRGLRENGADAFIDDYNINEESLKKYIQKGNIILVDFDTSKISRNYNINEKIDSRYNGETNHMALVKGYKMINDKLYFEFYDPYSANEKDENGEYVGKNRYYLGSEVIEGIKSKRGGFIVVKGESDDMLGDKGEQVTLEPYLEKAIREDLGIKSGAIYEGDLKRVLEIRVVQEKINDFSNIEKMTNIEKITIVNCGLTDIEFLENMKRLRYVCFNMNEIEDISKLSKFENLQTIEIAENKVSDLSPINNLKKLVGLYVWKNPISDLSIIENRENKINYVDVQNN